MAKSTAARRADRALIEAWQRTIATPDPSVRDATAEEESLAAAYAEAKANANAWEEAAKEYRAALVTHAGAAKELRRPGGGKVLIVAQTSGPSVDLAAVLRERPDLALALAPFVREGKSYSYPKVTG